MKRYTKLISALLLLLTAVVMVITTSFAWMTLSSTPVAQGIQIAISGSHTVLVAPDIAYEVDGVVYHYPGTFSDNMNFSNYSQYDYLQDLGGLMPVSTSDGETWYIPTYYQRNDPDVINGLAVAGELKPTGKFAEDLSLEYANTAAGDFGDSQYGHYVYVDFWVVAPVDGYKLRVSTGAEGAGSFVVPLPVPQETVTAAGQTYQLADGNRNTAASLRVGFLVNENVILDQSMLYYSDSAGYNDRYSKLQGVYNEKGIIAPYGQQTRFTIYEPNGDSHPGVVTDGSGNVIKDGQYVVTHPLGTGGVPTSVSDRLSVQLTNGWLTVGEETMISQMFNTFMAGRNTDGETAQTLKNKFYAQWLQHQIYPYVTKGNFISNTSDLYSIAGTNGVIGSDEIDRINQAGATDDTYLTELTGGVPQKIRMYIWLEGQDVDCVNTAASGSIAISIELAGSNAD